VRKRKILNHCLAGAVFLASALGLCQAAGAVPVTILYTSTVDTSSLVGGSATDPLTLKFTYDTGASPGSFGGSWVGAFGTLQIGSNLLTFTNGYLVLENDSPPDMFEAQICTASICASPFVASVSGTVYGQTFSQFYFQLIDSTGAMLSDTLPPATFDASLADFASQELKLNGGTFDVEESPPFSVTVTPLPAALPLFAGGLAGLGLLARRRKRKRAAVAAAA
jgi:hypothetical protein